MIESIVDAAIEAYVNKVLTLEEARSVALRELRIQTALPQSCEKLDTTIGNIIIWSGYAAAGEPICLADRNDFGYSVSVYSGDEGIEGVAVYDGSDRVGVIGSVPKEEL